MSLSSVLGSLPSRHGFDSRSSSVSGPGTKGYGWGRVKSRSGGEVREREGISPLRGSRRLVCPLAYSRLLR